MYRYIIHKIDNLQIYHVPGTWYVYIIYRYIVYR